MKWISTGPHPVFCSVWSSVFSSIQSRYATYSHCQLPLVMRRRHLLCVDDRNPLKDCLTGYRSQTFSCSVFCWSKTQRLVDPGRVLWLLHKLWKIKFFAQSNPLFPSKASGCVGKSSLGRRCIRKSPVNSFLRGFSCCSSLCPAHFFFWAVCSSFGLLHFFHFGLSKLLARKR